MAETTTPHKWTDAIHAWADGKPIQLRYKKATTPDLEQWKGFKTVKEGALPNFNNPNLEWRPTPPRRWYRIAIIKSNPPPRMVLVENEIQEKHMQESEDFIRWYDTRTEYDPEQLSKMNRYPTERG